MAFVKKLGSALIKIGALVRAAGWATLLGILETLQSKRGRRVLGVAALAGLAIAVLVARPIRSIAPGEAAVRVNLMTGGVTILDEGWVVVLPLVHEFRRYPLRDQIYRPVDSARADGQAPFQSVEGLSLGVEVAVRWAIDPAKMSATARLLPDELTRELVEPAVDGVLHRTFATHTVRDIFAGKRAEIQKAIEDELRTTMAGDGLIIRSVAIGNVDLPAQYRAGLEALLAEELSSDKMKFTLELKQKQIQQTALEADADKVRREKAAEAAGSEEIIAAKSKEEAMKHILPLREKEIEEKRLEAEASRVVHVKEAEGNADARRIEAGGEADSRRTLADSDAYRLDVTGKATSEQMAREAALIQKNPLLIQKTLADKLSDKIQVIIAPPGDAFLGSSLLGKAPAEPAKEAGGN